MLFLHSFQAGERVECFSGEDDGRAMRGSCHVPEDTAEAVEEGWWTDDDIFRREEHAIADLVAVVEDGAVR